MLSPVTGIAKSVAPLTLVLFITIGLLKTITILSPVLTVPELSTSVKTGFALMNGRGALGSSMDAGFTSRLTTSYPCVLLAVLAARSRIALAADGEYLMEFIRFVPGGATNLIAGFAPRIIVT
ncbi:MAG: hypothetical protein ACD_47C00522G0001 [uncultured bacterium]|nr:MAG: hypothetical protein ACD_47C00522G0001 [uncultured bacterium]